MHSILPIFGVAAYLFLAVGDFFFKPEMLFIPVSLALVSGILLGGPWAVRRWLKPAPLSVLGATTGALCLLAVSAGLTLALIPAKLNTYGIVQLITLHVSLTILAGVILRQERG